MEPMGKIKQLLKRL